MINSRSRSSPMNANLNLRPRPERRGDTVERFTLEGLVTSVAVDFVEESVVTHFLDTSKRQGTDRMNRIYRMGTVPELTAIVFTVPSCLSSRPSRLPMNSGATEL